MKPMTAMPLLSLCIFGAWLLQGCGGKEQYEMIVEFPKPAQAYKDATQMLRIFSLISVNNGATCPDLISGVHKPEDDIYSIEDKEEIVAPFTESLRPLKVLKKDTRTRLFFVEGDDGSGNILVRGCREVHTTEGVHSVPMSLGEACPPGIECTSVCDNSVVELGESCEIEIPTGQAGACPTSCDDGNSCTTDRLLNAGTCQAVCRNEPITTCTNGDFCCPAGCDSTNDDDCSNTCGDNHISANETCDPPETCPTSCDDGKACTIDTMTGSAANCNVACSHQAITQCKDDDGCCPAGCNAKYDSDCTANCGNGVFEPGETCDTVIPVGQAGACPTSCTAPDSCTTTELQNAGTCTAICVNTSIITTCISGDGCCPAGCHHDSDTDCACTCGDSSIDASCDESCDPPNGASCDANCHSLLGTWYTRIQSKATTTAPSPVGTLSSCDVDIIERMYVSVASSTQLNFTIEICKLSLSNGNPPIWPVCAPALPFLKTPTSLLATMPPTPFHFSDSIPIPDFEFLVGILSDGVTPVDIDNDSKPGISIPFDDNAGGCGGMGGFVDYLGFDMKVKFTSKLTDKDTITGTTSITATGKIFSSSIQGSDSGYSGPFTVTLNQAETPFTAKHLNGDISCSDILAKFP